MPFCKFQSGDNELDALNHVRKEVWAFLERKKKEEASKKKAKKHRQSATDEVVEEDVEEDVHEREPLHSDWGDIRDEIVHCKKRKGENSVFVHFCDVTKCTNSFAWKSMHQKDLYAKICMQAAYKRTPLMICRRLRAYKVYKKDPEFVHTRFL